MPRRRKGPPQESVDSILLAISRRNDIDADTMAHYFDRLDEEWADGAREKVLQLLRSSDAMAHAAAILILSELATDFDLEELEDFVTDPTVGDMAKLSLSPILKELGSEMADTGLIEYLNDPSGAVQQMQSRLLDLVGQSEVGVESILDDVISMPVERRLAFVGWLGSSNDPRAVSLLIPLLETQPSKVVAAVIDALEQLGSIATHQSIPALNHMLAIGSNRHLKEHARAVLGRLTMQASPGTEEAAMSEVPQQLTAHEARVSFLDGSGSQLIMLSWLRPDGLVKGFNVLYQDEWGIKDCYGIDEMDQKRWSELVNNLDSQGFGSFTAPVEYACALILEARALNRRSRRRVPIAYVIWRPLIEIGENKAVTSLPPAPLNADTIALAQQGEKLYSLPEFVSWMYEPMPRIEPYITRYWAALDPFDVRTGGKHSVRRGKQKTKGQKSQLEDLITEALGELVDDKWRALYHARLLRQAAFFQYTQREEHTALICAVAAVLQPDSGISVQEQAFPRAMIRNSIEQGPLRMMVESLNTGNLSSLPFDFPSNE